MLFIVLHYNVKLLYGLVWEVSPGLDLLFQVVLHSHAQLVELVPLLGQTHSAVLCVFVVQDQRLLHGCSQILDLLQLTAHGTNLLVLALQRKAQG